MSLSKPQARRFLLRYHGLYGGFHFTGTDGIMDFIRRVGCIQFDPLNVVGTNPELVLQSRIENFHPDMLWNLLYRERRLVDYWDKMLAIFPVEDWPYFERKRKGFEARLDVHKGAADSVLEEIRHRGALSSGDLPLDEKVDWAWGPTRLSRAALEGMYHAGQLVIHHKIKSRKYYDLAERHIPAALFGGPDPFESDERYYDWYVLRRIGSVGLLWNRPGDAWLGIDGFKSAQRKEAFRRLLASKRIREIEVEGLGSPLYMRSADAYLLEEALSASSSAPERASILAPLDNLLWDRSLIHALFDFEYRWEVYKPAAERKYGYYVLPVVYGDRIVARFEPVRYKRGLPLAVHGWWWEPGVVPDEPVRAGVRQGLERFAGYLGTTFDQAEVSW